MRNLDSISYSPSTLSSHLLIKKLSLDLLHAIDTSIPPSSGHEALRSKAIALEKLEECHMWTGRALRDQQIEQEQNA